MVEPIATFSECDSSIVSDAMDEHGLDGVVTGLEPAAAGHTAVGRARPVRFERARGDGLTNFPYEMLEAVAPDELFVLSGVGPDISCWGGQASALAENAGMAGVIIDGGYRDLPDIRNGSFPVFGRAATPRSGQGRIRVESTTEPVTVDDVRVEREDIIVADATGIVVVPSESAEPVAETAADILDAESDLAEKVTSGTDLESIRDDHDRF